MKKTIGFIGTGNMASAIIDGMVSSKAFAPMEICVYDKDLEKADQTGKKYGVTVCENNEQLLRQCRAVVLAVKPIALPELLTSLSETFVNEKNLVISIAAGQSIEKLRGLIGTDLPIIRVMPNINAIAGESISGYAVNELVSNEDRELLEKVLDSTGKSVEIREEQFSVYSAIAGCSPAYVYNFIDTIARVGVKHGIYKKDALELATKCVLESAKKLSNGDIEDNIKTILADKKSKEASDKLDENNFEKIIADCLSSALNKDKKM